MRQRKRRLLGLTALLTASTMLFGACGSGTPGESKGDGGEGKTTITFWQRKFQKVEDNWYKENVAKFNASQDKVHVNYSVIPGDAWDQKMKAAQAAGNAPDVYLMAYNNLGSSFSSGMISDLSDVIGSDQWGELTDSARDMVTFDGKQVAYPLLVEPSTVLWYREDMFKAAGLDPDKPPTTWDELVADAKKLTKGDSVFGIQMAQSAEDMGWSTWGLQYNAAGQLPLSGDWSKADADNPAYKPLLQMYQDLYSDGSLPKQALAPYTDPTPFGQGKLAMMANGSWAGSELLNNYPEIAKVTRAAAFPSIDGDKTKPTATLGGWTMVVDGKSEKKQAAADFISWLAAGDPQIMADYYKITQYSKFAVRDAVTDVINADPDADKINPWRQTIAEDIVPYAKPEGTYDWSISLAFAKAIEGAMKGGNIDKELAEAQKDITKLIDKLGIAGKGPDD